MSLKEHRDRVERCLDAAFTVMGPNGGNLPAPPDQANALLTYALVDAILYLADVVEESRPVKVDWTSELPNDMGGTTKVNVTFEDDPEAVAEAIETLRENPPRKVSARRKNSVSKKAGPKS